MPPTRKDVAQLAKVAESTAGMILAGRGQRYSERTRQKVLRAAKQLDYRPNLAGRSLRMQRSFLIGVLLNAANTTLAAEFLRGVQGHLIEFDCAPLVFSHRSAIDEEKCLRCCLDRRVDGLIVNAALNADGRVEWARYQSALKPRLPVVEVFGRFLKGVPAANLDNFSAGRFSAQHLIELGHRRIVFLVHQGYDRAKRTGMGAHFDAWDRFRGYEEAMLKAGLDPLVITHARPDDVCATEDFAACGRTSLPAILEHPTRPTAVVCYTDYQAVGLFRAARLANIPMPKRLSVVGFGDTELSRIVDPALTTLQVPAFEIGRETARMVLQMIQGETADNVTVPCEMVVRESAVHLAGRKHHLERH